jgi:hypothetical protein
LSQWSGRKLLYIPTPGEIAAPLFWFEAESVVKDGDNKISQATDLSGNGHHGTATGAARPTYLPPSEGVNNHAAFGFNGTSEFFTLPAAISAALTGLDTPYSIGLALRYTGGNGTLFAVASSSSDNPFDRVRLDTAVITKERRNNGGVNAEVVYANDLAVGDIATFSGAFSGTTWTAHMNGARMVNEYDANANGILNLNIAAVGCLLRAAATSFYAGVMSEIIVYPSILNSAQLQALANFFVRKYIDSQQ